MSTKENIQDASKKVASTMAVFSGLQSAAYGQKAADAAINITVTAAAGALVGAVGQTVIEGGKGVIRSALSDDD